MTKKTTLKLLAIVIILFVLTIILFDKFLILTYLRHISYTSNSNSKNKHQMNNLKTSSNFIYVYDIENNNFNELNKQNIIFEKRKGIYVMDSEVTQKEWFLIMGYNPSYNTKCGDDCPVENVSFNEAAEYANKLSFLNNLEECYTLDNLVYRILNKFCLGYRLPTLYDWYIYSDYEIQIKNITKYAVLNSHFMSKVKSKKPNKHGIYDVFGNVSEILNPPYDYEEETKLINPWRKKIRAENSKIIHYGAAFFNGHIYFEQFLLWEFMYISDQYEKNPAVGFRLVRSVY